MRTFGLILAAAAVAAVNGAGVLHSETGDIVITPSGQGTTVFIDASAESGKTSIQQIGAKFASADAKLATALGTVTSNLADAKAETESAIEALDSSVTASLVQAEDELARTVSTLNTALGAAVTEAKGYADQAIKETVTPALVKVAADLSALEIKIKKDIDEGIKKDLDLYKNILIGTASILPAANCAAIESARPGSPDGAYYIGNKLRVWCAKVGNSFVSLGGDGSTQALAGSSCFDVPLPMYKPKDMKKWVDPDANAENTANAKKVVCEPKLMVKLVTTDGHIAHWDSKFWKDTNLMNEDNAYDSKWPAYGKDIKASAYLSPIGAKIEIRAYTNKDKKLVGTAYYNIKKEYQSKSLKWLLVDQGKSNLVFATKDNGKSAKGRPIYTKYMYQRGGNWGQRPYDMFLDTTGSLVSKQRNYGGSRNSWTRLSTTDRSGWKGGHVYAGIGGWHDHGWKVQFEASPIVGYCGTYNRYGTDAENTKGGPNPNVNCGTVRRQTDMDFAILKV